MLSSSLLAALAATLLAAPPVAAFGGRVAVPQTPAASRRAFLARVATAPFAAAATAVALPAAPARAAGDTAALVADLRASLDRLTPVPSLVEAGEWDKIRTILKTTPVAQLWNLGESQNTLTRLAKETGDFELLELKDELAISLQMTDEIVYANNFIYYQPGNGKVKVKEPLEMANKAIVQLKEALAVADPA